MEKLNVVRSVLKEYGIAWGFNRAIYSVKLQTLRSVPAFEKIFEHKTQGVQRIDIFDIDTDAISEFLSVLGEDKKSDLIKRADLALVGKIQAFSSFLLDYGNPVRWNYNPLTGKSVDMKLKWYQISDFDNDRGDIKVIWEASRFSHLYLFSRAYLLTRDRKYYTAFHRQIVEWVRFNPYSFGPNYKCGQECALRMINVLMNYTVFCKEGLTNEEDEKAVKTIVLGSYKKILSNFFYADKCIKNNHTISELLGMVVGAWCCEDFRKLAYAYKKMDKVIKEQFFEDGGYRQYSFNYQRLALQDIECLISISGRTGYDISPESRDRVLKSVQMLYQVQADDGDVPNYGSNDGALIFPVTECNYRDFRPIVQTLNILLTGKKVYDFGLYDEELLWFSEKKLNEVSLENLVRETKMYMDAGLYSFRTGKEHMMIVLNNFHTRPAHFDQMHLDLWLGNMNLLCDSGTYSYASDIGKELMRTGAHNTVIVDGREQMNLYGAFLTYGWTKRKKISVSKKSFEGIYQSSKRYIHERKINIMRKENGTLYEVTDKIYSNTAKNFEIIFHTPYHARKFNDNIVLIEEKGKTLCKLKGSNIEITESKRSLFYMKTDNIYCIRFAGKIEDCVGNKDTVIEVLN